MGAVGPDGEIDWDCPCLQVRRCNVRIGSWLCGGGTCVAVSCVPLSARGYNAIAPVGCERACARSYSNYSLCIESLEAAVCCCANLCLGASCPI